jgi:hypothetical protein
VKPVLVALSGALLLALGASACGSGSQNAATVGGSSISRSEFESELRAYAANSKYDAYLKANNEAGTGATRGTVSNDFARSTLKTDILFEVLHQEIQKRGLTVLPTTDPEVQAQTISRFDSSGSPDNFYAFPKSFQDRALRQTAYLITLQNSLGGGPLTDAQVKALYDANPRQFADLCVSHILVGSEAEAKAVLAKLNAGANFATLAAQESTDPGAQDSGGKLTNPDGSCPNATALDADFVKGVLAASPGKPTQPVHTQYGWHIILLDKIEVQPFDKVKTAVRSSAENKIADKAATPLNKVLQAGLKEKITIDPRYGVWDPGTQQILPPGFKTPATRAPNSTRPGATTSTPSSSAALTPSTTG